MSVRLTVARRVILSKKAVCQATRRSDDRADGMFHQLDRQYELELEADC